uniref:GDNF/GAS1 domain-containing protein n=1 Tax=Gopherus agassizii TaxID=38772 RepID=A0A452IUW5_9SAUR
MDLSSVNLSSSFLNPVIVLAFTTCSVMFLMTNLGNSCKAKDSVGCNTTIQFLVDQYPQFKDCICTKDDVCSFKLLLGKQCRNLTRLVFIFIFMYFLYVLFLLEYTENGTCFDVNKECIEDEVCNKQLSLYLKVCSVTRKQCNMEQCQAAIRFFYQNMPFNVAQMLTFCDCTQPDESCQQAKELLHGKPCAVNIVPPPSCLNVIHRCKDNELCRKKYEVFRSKCWRHVTKRCYDDKACLETLIEDDLNCSGSADCRAAYIDNWGTMLRVECTCNTVPLAEQSLCKLFHHLLHSKSCFIICPSLFDLSSYGSCFIPLISFIVLLCTFSSSNTSACNIQGVSILWIYIEAI